MPEWRNEHRRCDNCRSAVTARLHPLWAGGRADYVYSVIFDGKLLVEGRSDPECDAARALLAMGYTGKLTLLDGKTAKPRTVIDIEKAARLRVSEESRNGLRFRKMNPAGSPYSPEEPVAGLRLVGTPDEASAQVHFAPTE
jgi:hypothetical protein